MERQFHTEENRHEISQSEGMARYAGLELTTEEIQMYIYARQSKDPDYVGLSDQRILDLCLSPEKQIIYENFYKNMRF